MNFVYMLRCGDGSLYTGWTSDLVARVKKHASGKGAKCTRAHLPISLAYFEIYDTASEAQRREYAIKQLSKTKKEELIHSGKGFPCTAEDGKTIVTVPSGTYFISSPITLKGAENWDIRGEDGATFSCSMPLGDAWESHDGGVWRIKTDRKADALYVGGKKYTMARYPKYNPLIPVFGGFSRKATAPEKTAEWQDPTGGYIHAMHAHNWGGYIYKILGKDESGELILTGGHQNNRQMGMHRDFRYAENIFEEMTEPGEWFFDEKNGYVYAIPYEGDDLTTAEITVGSAFLRLERCRDVTVRNLTFTHGARTFMEPYEPLLRSDWTIYRGGSVYFNRCERCTLSACTFTDVGSNAVFVDGQNEEILIEKTHFSEIGASAVCFVGGADSVRSPLFESGQRQNWADVDKKPGPRTKNYPRNCTVDDCLIRRVGVVEKQATGVEISMARGITVRNSTLCDASRAAINVSEGTFGGHLIEGCDVFDTVKETGDHGSFNSWGRDRFWHVDGLPDEELYKYAFLDCDKTVIRNNRFRCDRGWDIDLDDGSSNYEIYGNLCLNGGIKLREGFGRYVHHNITVNNSIHMHVWYPNSGDVVERNLLFRGYQPILMKVRWGKSFDFNVLHTAGQIDPIPAESLMEASGMDENSVCLDAGFVDPASGDYRTTNPVLADFAAFATDFGVRYEPLRRIAPTPVLPDFKAEEAVSGSTVTMFDMKVKNIETDGEMSAYATAGHDGVLIVDADHFGDAISRGLLPGDVIVAVGEIRVDHTEDLTPFSADELNRLSITVLRAQGRTVLPPK